MFREGRHAPIALMALHMLWGVVLWFSISKYGLGVSTDAVHLLFGGQNLAAGDGLTSYDGNFIAFWPPLYPALLGLVRLITGVDILLAATILQVAAFLGLGLTLSQLFLRIFTGRLVPAAIALVLTQAGSVVVAAAGMVGSDYVHVLLAMLAVYLTARYVESGSRVIFGGLAATLVLVTLQRYLGIAATATAVAGVLLLRKVNWRRRLAEAGALGLTMVPMAVWLALTSQLYARRAPITFQENFEWFSRSVLEWFVGAIPRKADLTLEIAALWAGVAALATAALILTRRGRAALEPEGQSGGQIRAAWPFVVSLLMYAGFYFLALFGSAAAAYFNKLGGRFILPLFLPLTTVPVIVADRLVESARRSTVRGLRVATAAVCGIALAGLGYAVLRTTYPLVMESRAGGVAGGDNSFNNERWRENPAILYWEGHRPTDAFLLFSNEPDGVAFLTRHAAHPAPRRITGPYGTNETPVNEYRSELFGPGLSVYLMWIEPSSYDYYYPPQRLEEIAVMESLFSNEMGSVYRLSPR